MRFRHADSDIVRAARQQDFLRAGQGPDQHEPPARRPQQARRRSSRRYTQTDANLQLDAGDPAPAQAGRSSRPARSPGRPIRESRSRPTLRRRTRRARDGYVRTPTCADVRRVPDAARAPRLARAQEDDAARRDADRRRRRPDEAGRPRDAAWLDAGAHGGRGPRRATAAAGTARASASTSRRWLTPTGRYASDADAAPRRASTRSATAPAIRTSAYRLVVAREPDRGQYYGIQGTTWRTPPILDRHRRGRDGGGRTLQLYYDGSRLRLGRLANASVPSTGSPTRCTLTLTNAPDARHRRAPSTHLGAADAPTPSDDRPPRLAWRMYKRFVLGGAHRRAGHRGDGGDRRRCWRSRTTAIIFENSTAPIPGIEGALDDVDAGRPADDPRPRLRPPLRRHQGEEPGPLGHDHPAAAGPVKGATAVHVDPARPQGPHPRPRRPTRSTPPTRSAARRSPSRRSANLLHIPINHVVNVNFGGFRARSTGSAASTPTSTAATSTTTTRRSAAAATTRRSTSRPATRSSAARTRSTTSATATSTPTSSAPRASRSSCARPRTRSASAGCSATARRCCGSSAATRRPTSLDQRDPAAAQARVRVGQNPVHEVHFRGDISGDYVTVADDDLAEATAQF